MTSPAVALILGAGPRIGISVAEKFASLGYGVAIASRKGTGKKDDRGFLSLHADFTKSDTIPPLFAQVKQHLNAAPSVVVYNAAAFSRPPVADSALSIGLNAFVKDLDINTVSPYVAAHEAVKGWETLPAETKKTFIYTGNALNTQVFPVPSMMTLGVGKSASAYWIGAADLTYKEKGYRFFFADERYADGKVKGDAIDGPAHADFYAQLAGREGDVPWLATFVKDQGYTSFK